jgi:hypothetical protein
MASIADNRARENTLGRADRQLQDSAFPGHYLFQMRFAHYRVRARKEGPQEFKEKALA